MLKLVLDIVTIRI